MTSREATTASPEILFDIPPSSSPELSFSTPRAEPVDVHEDSKISGQDVDASKKVTEHESNGDLAVEYADKPSSNELEGLRTVNLTPTSNTSDGKQDAESDPNAKRTSSPPIVLKSAPGTPTAEQVALNESVKQLDGDSHEQKAPAEDLDDPRELVISSLRTQISDLFSQVNLLNSKLVQSYDRVSTLEETLDDNTERLRAIEGERMNLEREKSVLEMERAKQEQMVKDGRLVERSAVAAELTRLMEESMASSNAKLSAEAKHKQMESELSDLSANLFSTANEMVATERQLRASVEESLASTKASNALLEKQLEATRLQLGGAEREKEILREQAGRTEKETEELRKALRGVNSSNVMSQGTGGILRMMNSHAPYKNEYLGFLAHLRGMVTTTPNVPAVTSLLTLPFLARLAVEDSEPTLRLDLAPSLNWLTRRSALAAIHSNTLLIEQIHVATLFLEGSASSYSYGGFGTTSSLPTSPTQLTKVNCSLCGKVVYMSPEAIQAEQDQAHGVIASQSPITPTPATFQTPPVAPSPQRSVSAGGWGASKFLKSVTLPSLGSVVSGSGSSGGRSNSPAPRHSLDSIPTPISSTGPLPPFPLDRPYSPPPPTSLQTVIHAFRIPIAGKSANTSTTNLAGPDASQSAENYGPPYPLCHTGWCLSRLRATLDLWGCVKSEVIERVWVDGELERRRLGNGSGHNIATPTFEVKGAVPAILDSYASEKDDSSGPPVPPKRRIPNLWGMGRDALDKAKAYGSGSPGSDGAVVTPTTTSSSGATGFLGGVRRTFSGSAVLPSSTGSAVSDPEKTTAGNDNTAVAGEAGTGTVRAPAIPRRSIGRLSAVFTGAAQPGEAATSGGVQGAEATPNQDIQVQNTDADPVKPPAEDSLASPPIAPSASLDTFMTPLESPMQMLSPDPGDDTTKHGANAEALSTAIEGHLSSSKQDSADVVSPSSPEPPTPTPNSIGFGSGTTGASARHSHVRNTSIASIISEGNTVTPRPSTPSTESKIPTKAGSRPSTPGKTGAPPPVPRRAAARNAARTSIVAAPESPNQPKHDDTGGVGEPDAAAKAGDTVMASGAEPGPGKVDEEGATKEGMDIREADAKTAEGQGMTNETPSELTDSTAPTLDTSAAPQPSNGGSMLSNELSTVPGPIPEEPLFSATPESSAPAPLPVVEPPTPTSPSASPLPLSFDDANEDLEPSPVGHTRARQASVVSSSSAYSPSVYTTNSGVNAPAFPGGEPEHQKGGRHDETAKFYVGRESWEERAWLQLTEIRESMFWARLGGVRY